MDFLTYFKDDLETDRLRKIQAMDAAYNPIERELLERELILLDAQISWLSELLTVQATA